MTEIANAPSVTPSATADRTAASAGEANQPAETTAENRETRIYEAGEARRTILAFVFMVMLPFLISMPVMVILRGINGFWADAASATVLTALFGTWMLFLYINVQASFRSRVTVAPDTVEVATPRWRGPHPGIGYTKATVAFADIEKVQSRCEIYRAINVPVMTRATTLKLNDGRRVMLGYVNDNSPDPALDYPEIGRTIAEWADVPFETVPPVDGGTQVRALLKGPPDWSRMPLSENALKRMRRDNRWFQTGIALALFGLAGAGLLYDLYRSGLFSAAG
ncbi:MAG: hypothetical protein AAFZ01_12500 [Pseudomonadota bacterium]